jgi:hypothetical protein
MERLIIVVDFEKDVVPEVLQLYLSGLALDMGPWTGKVTRATLEHLSDIHSEPVNLLSGVAKKDKIINLLQSN